MTDTIGTAPVEKEPTTTTASDKATSPRDGMPPPAPGAKARYPAHLVNKQKAQARLSNRLVGTKYFDSGDYNVAVHKARHEKPMNQVEKSLVQTPNETLAAHVPTITDVPVPHQPQDKKAHNRPLSKLVESK